MMKLPITSCPSPAAHSCGLLNHPNSFRGGMFKLHTKFDTYLLLYLLSHFECDGHTVHMLTHWCLLSPLTSIQWSHHYSRMPIPVHSLCLPGYTDVLQTILVILINSGWTFSGWTSYIPSWNSSSSYKVFKAPDINHSLILI